MDTDREAHLAQVAGAIAGVMVELRELVGEAYAMASLPRLYPLDETIDQLLKASLLALELAGFKQGEEERAALAQAIRAYVAAPVEADTPAHPLDEAIDGMWKLARSRIPAAAETEASVIAASLTDLERTLLLGRAKHWGSWMWPVGCDLVAKGLGTRVQAFISLETPLAERVKAILLEQERQAA